MSQQPAWPGTQQYPAQQSADADPLEGGDKAPAISFKGAPIGTVYTMTVTAAAKLVQSRDFETGELAYWPGNVPGQVGNPKMAVVINGTVNGEERSLWATKPSDMLAALQKAQKDAGQRILPGGTLHVKLAGETPHDNPRLNAKKNYAAMYVPPVAADPIANGPEFAQPQVQAPVAQPQQQAQQVAQPAFPPQAAPAPQQQAPAPQQAAPATQAGDPFAQGQAQQAPSAGDPFAAQQGFGQGNPPY